MVIAAPLSSVVAEPGSRPLSWDVDMKELHQPEAVENLL